MLRFRRRNDEKDTLPPAAGGGILPVPEPLGGLDTEGRPMTADAKGLEVRAIIIAQGRTLDFIDGLTQRRDTPEEYVRQEIAKSLVREYRYSKADIEVEFTVRVGTRKPRADLVIFPPETRHAQENARIIVECKAPTVKSADKKDGVLQLQSYMAACPNVDYGMWANGIERYCYRRVVKEGKVSIEDVPDLPEFGRDEEETDRPRFEQLKPATSDALLFAFRRCHNYIAGNQGLQKPQAFWELLKLIFCKIHDERQNDEVEFFAGANERHGVNGPLKVQKRIEGLFAQVKNDYPTIFKKTETIELKPVVLAYLISQLQMYSLLESDVDVKGRAYEEIVGSNLRGDRGEFFTPRNVCRMAVAMLDPGEKQLVLDPACGTGGFLITAMNHVIEKIRSAEMAKWGNNLDRAEAATRERIRKFADRFIVGMDFNPDLVKATKMNMVMNNDGAGGLFQANSLEAAVTWEPDLRKRDLMGNVDVLFTNPPFGSKILVTDPAILEQYDLGHSWSYDKSSDRWIKTSQVQKSQPPEILFIERCVRSLKPATGRVAIVLPDGILGSPGLGYVREWILRQTRILASIDLHADTFQPFVSIQTSILVLQRKPDDLIAVELAAGQINDYAVFMAVANHVGHDKRGNTTYVRDRKGNRDHRRGGGKRQGVGGYNSRLPETDDTEESARRQHSSDCPRIPAMALRARLVAPPPAPQEVWPWHKLEWGSVAAAAISEGERRMEAETFLSSGFGIRAAIQAKPSGWVRFEKLAKVWMPGRLKGIQVSREYGTPFLAATQVYDARPVTRKWLALDRTVDAASRFVSPGTTLVTCSGSVGRPTISYAAHEDILISHDLLRVQPVLQRDKGWLYAYLHAPQVRAMTSSVKYGHIIKHLETSHLDAIPIPTVDEEVAGAFSRRLAAILDLRNESYRLALEAEARFEKALGPVAITDRGEQGFSVRASDAFLGGRRRLEASVHRPDLSAIRHHLGKNGTGFTRINEAGYEVWLPKRFRRIPAEDGILLFESAALTEINPDLSKRIADGDFGDPYRGRVEAGWLLMARSGQTYGIIGTVVLGGKDLEGRIISDDVIRIKPLQRARIQPGYLVTAMSHPTLGRPLLKALAYGSSIPHIDVADVAAQEIVRLLPAEESAIADLAESAAEARVRADVLEREIASDSGAILARFLAS